MSLKLVKSKRREYQTPIDLLAYQQPNVLFLENEVGFPDAAKLDLTDEESFLRNLKIRFMNKQIYTCIESTVIAINPYERLPLYSREIIAAYEHHNILALPPHIFALCEYVLHCLKERRVDQCILTSGVSGSGKTESLKVVLSYFIYGSNERSELNQIKTRLSLIPAIIEAFSSASTEHNYNSTRLVYMFEIDFDFRGDPLGGQINFLEKTRVAKEEIFGYNFHIFYQLLGGGGSNLLKFLKLKRNVDCYQLLKETKPSDIVPIPAQSRAEEFRNTKLTLQLLGFTSNEILECFQVIAFILKLGNVQFLRRSNMDSTEGCAILADQEIFDICEVFHLDPVKFQNLLTQKVVRNNDELIVTELSASLANKVKHSLCKALYCRLLNWIITKINELIKTRPSTTLSRNNLTLVDTFGFESYNINCFEQLLINYFYEKSQQIFVHYNFCQKQEEYIREEIPWRTIECTFNDMLCELIEKPRNGILALVEQQSSQPFVFQEELLIQTLNTHCRPNLHYTEITNPVLAEQECNGYRLHCLPHRRLSGGDVARSSAQMCFAIKHYLGTAVYSVNDFIEKNTDHISREWSQLLYQSKHTLLKNLFPEGSTTQRKTLKKPITLATQFLIALEYIVAKLQNKELHFIKCIQPNRLKMPAVFDEDYVHRQMASQLLIEHSAFLKLGYFFCESYNTFFARFRILCTKTWPTWSGTHLKGVYTLLHNRFNGQLKEFAFGKEKIFVKHLKTLVELEEYRCIKLAEVATSIQKNIRSWLQRCKFLRAVQSERKIARFYRNWKRKSYLLWLANNLPSRSPLCRDWPPAPRSLKETSYLLRKLFHKWRCHRYLQLFDQNNRNRMREKMFAMILFRNQKASYRSSVAHPFRGDYIRLRQNVKWKRLLPSLGEVYIVFADLVSKITKRCGKFVQKLVVISTTSFLVLDHRTMQISQNIALGDIFKISTSPYMDNILIIHIYTGQQEDGLTSRAFIFESSHLIELITKLFLVIKNAFGKGPTVEISQEFEVFTGKETLVLIFKSRTPPEISSHHVRISRKSNRLEITI